MRGRPLPRLSWLLVLACVAFPVYGADTSDPKPADAKRGELAVALRYRFEDVAQDIFARDAHASTLRTTVSYRSPTLAGVGGFIEFEDVADLGLGKQHANAAAGSLSNGVVDRPVIADPESTEVEQAYLRYSGLRKTTFDVGRQEINLGEQRFVGAVGWRQNHQSFDALHLTQRSLPRTVLHYALVSRVNRVFGDRLGMRSHLLLAEITLGEVGRLSPYAYLLDYEGATAAALSTSTYGARWQGRVSLDDGWSVPYHLELARQVEAGDNPDNVDARYWRVEAGISRAGHHLAAGVEVLQGSATEGRFTTPLATLHRFNGWADIFLLTPSDGLEDRYVEGGGAPGDLSWAVVYHDFRAESGSADYGTEVDAQLAYRAPWEQTLALTLARYHARDLASDTTKIWLWTTFRF